MEELLKNIFALYGTLKNLHYTASGLSFYSLHKQADDMLDGLLDFADEIQENFYLASGTKFVDFASIFDGASKLMSTTDDSADACLRSSLLLISNMTAMTQELKTDSVEDIFSRLNNHLFKIKGFVLRTIA